MRYLLSFCFGLCVAHWCHADVAVSGVSGAVAEAVEGYLEAELKGCTPEARPELPDLERAARKALDALGYFQAEIGLTWRSPCDLGASIVPRETSIIASWHVGYADRAAIDAADVDWVRGQTRAGGPFVPDTYEATKRRLVAGLRDRGHLDAELTLSDVLVDTQSNTADIQWIIDTGPRYTTRNIIVEQSTLDDAFLRRYLTVQEGKPLLQRDLLTSYENLNESDYFSRVRIAPLPETRADGEIDVKVTAERIDPWSVLGGVGFATDTGPRVRAQATARYLNERGHRFGVSSLLSPVQGDGKVEYRWPYGDPTHQWYAAQIRLNYEDTDTARSTGGAIGLRRMTRLSRRWTWTAYTDIASERFDVSAQEGRSQLWLLGSNLTFTSAIDAPRPRRGRSLTLDVRGAHSALFSDNDVLQLRVHAKQIVPFLGRSRWILRGELGATWQAEFQDLPASLRFFAGGDKSVRGYALESLGPEDEFGDVVGGERLLVGSAELDVPVRSNWSVAFFTDVGSAYDDSPDFSRSLGIGVRWYSPLGPIRLDLAHPLDESDQAVRVHISIGPDL